MTDAVRATLRAGTLEREVKRLGRDCGFDLVRITDAGPLHVERARYLDWIAEGRQGEMRWITPERAERSTTPGSVLAGARSAISVAVSYWAGHRPARSPNSGAIARYAWGRDYHAVLGERLDLYVQRLCEAFGGAHRWYVDTGPLMDKALAARAGLGWYGKNTNILTEALGSFVVLGEIVTTVELRPDRPIDRSCGACRACLAACPTGALDAAYRIDSRKCISYLTIEHRDSIPRDLRAKLGNWVFGCDICQDVCPPTMEPHLTDTAARRQWTADLRHYVRSPVSPDTGDRCATVADYPLGGGRPAATIDLIWLLRLSHQEYVERFRGTAIRRAKVWMLRRNAAVALGNTGDAACISALGESATGDEHPVVREHAVWALGRLAIRLHRMDPIGIFQSVLSSEQDERVRHEARLSLAEMTAAGST